MFEKRKSLDFTLLPQVAVPFILNLKAKFQEKEGLRLAKTSTEIVWCFALALIMTDRVEKLDLTGALYPESIKENNRYDAIALALTYNKSIKHLILDDCHFTLSGAQKIAEALRISNVRTVSLVNCRFEENGKELIRDALQLRRLDKYTFSQIDQLAQTIYIENEKMLDVKEAKPRSTFFTPQQKTIFIKTADKKSGYKKYGFGSGVPRF
ncbi:MAG: hypothetical protein ACYCQI_04875 [Gammaproteobacteria bacterium]